MQTSRGTVILGVKKSQRSYDKIFTTFLTAPEVQLKKKRKRNSKQTQRPSIGMWRNELARWTHNPVICHCCALKLSAYRAKDKLTCSSIVLFCNRSLDVSFQCCPLLLLVHKTVSNCRRNCCSYSCYCRSFSSSTALGAVVSRPNRIRETSSTLSISDRNSSSNTPAAVFLFPSSNLPSSVDLSAVAVVESHWMLAFLNRQLKVELVSR